MVYNKDKHGIYANYSRGFVPPSVGQLYKGKEVPNLNPSVFNNLEMGSHAVFLKGKLYVDGALFYLRGENEVISVTQDNGTRINENAGETEHYGIEFLIDYKISSEVKLTASEAFSKHKFVDYVEKGKNYSGNEMRGAPQYNSSILLAYKPNFLSGFNVGLELQSLGGYYTDNANKIRYEGHHFFNLRAGYKFSQFYIWTNLLNVSDEVYANRASTGFGRTTFTPGNPRNITVGIRYSLK